MPEENYRHGRNGGRSDRGRGRSSYNGNDRDDFSFDIVESYGTVAVAPSGWTKELNRVSWNGNEPKYDIREWSPDHERMRRGVTFTDEEVLELKDLLDAALCSVSGPLTEGVEAAS